MSLATPRRTFGALLWAVPLAAALIAAPSALAAPADTGPYTNVELQARSNLLVNDEGYNLPPGSSYNSITPAINNAAQVAFRVQSVAYPDPGSSVPGVWLGGSGHGKIVHTGDAGWSISSDPGINAHGDILFTLSPSIVSSNLYL